MATHEFLFDPNNPANEADDRIALADACLLLPKTNGKHPHLHTVRAWAARGVKGHSGKRVRLRAFRIGQRYFTRIRWINNFIEQLTDGMDGTDERPVETQMLNDRERSQVRSEAHNRLVARGFYRENRRMN